MLKIKVCGITNIKDAKMCENLGADALGFIFYEKSKRYVTPEKAKSIIEQVSPFTVKIGVFVNQSAEFINQTASTIKLNAVQLHGDESHDFIDQINLPVIKSFRVNDNFDYSIISKYKQCGILLDSYSPNRYGGTGKIFNWENIPDNLKGKIILSGGISAANLEYIINKIKPAYIDISSSLEIEPGVKDERKAKKFFSLFNKLRSKQC